MDLAELAENRATLSHEMSTTSRGRIIATTRGTRIGKHGPTGGEPVGLAAANIYEEPDDVVFGANGCIGFHDACCAWTPAEEK